MGRPGGHQEDRQGGDGASSDAGGIRINPRKKKLDRNQARVARAGERQNLGSDTMLGISNLYSQEAKGQYIYMYRCGEYAENPSYKQENTQYII
jgi:hypothetical protein